MLSEDSKEGFGRQGDRRKSDMEAMVNRMIKARGVKASLPPGAGACRKGWRRNGFAAGFFWFGKFIGQAGGGASWGGKAFLHGACKIRATIMHAAAALQRCNGYLSLSSKGPGAYAVLLAL